MLRRLLCIFPLVLLVACAGIKPPTLLEEIEPEYPEEARKEGLEGTVTLYLLVSEEGNVDVAWVKKSSGYKILDDAAIAYAKKLKFSPARKNGKPISVWMSWIVKYKALPAHFLPKEYVEKVQRLYEQAGRFEGEERSRILQEILDQHEDYVRYLENNPWVNLNDYLRLFVTDEVYETWKDFWPVWPLRFAVYHDFVVRFPDASETGYAASRLVELIKEDIGKIKEKAKTDRRLGAKRELLLRTLYGFLLENYPESMTPEMKREAQRYLQAKSK